MTISKIRKRGKANIWFTEKESQTEGKKKSSATRRRMEEKGQQQGQGLSDFGAEKSGQDQENEKKNSRTQREKKR